MDRPDSSAPTARVARALAAGGLQPDIRHFPAGTHTAAAAAAALGIAEACIVKSLVFMAGEEPLLALVSGANRVDEARLAALVGHPVRKASADEVRAASGFAIGGVAPVGHPRRLRSFVDRDLLRYARVWAAAGTPSAVFALSPADLVRLTGGQTAELAQPVLSARPGAGG